MLWLFLAVTWQLPPEGRAAWTLMRQLGLGPYDGSCASPPLLITSSTCAPITLSIHM